MKEGKCDLEFFFSIYIISSTNLKSFTGFETAGSKNVLEAFAVKSL